MRVTLVSSLVGLVVTACTRPEEAAQPGAVSRPLRASNVAGAQASSGGAAAKPHASASAPASASKEDAPRKSPTPGGDAPLLPDGFVAVLHPMSDGKGESKSALCGKLRVENVRGHGEVYEPFVMVTDTITGKTIYEAHGQEDDWGDGQKKLRELTASACGDVTGDGVPELLLTEKTMGAHCCYTHYVTSMTSPTQLIMAWEKGDSGDGVWPVKLKPGPVWQIQSVTLVSPPFDVEAGDPPVPYAYVPGFPIIFDLVSGQYQKRTFAFLDVLRKERDQDRAACITRPNCESNHLYEWGMALMLGEWEAQKEQIVPDDVALRERLDVRAFLMKKKLRAQLGD